MKASGMAKQFTGVGRLCDKPTSSAAMITCAEKQRPPVAGASTPWPYTWPEARPTFRPLSSALKRLYSDSISCWLTARKGRRQQRARLLQRQPSALAKQCEAAQLPRTHHHSQAPFE